MKTILRLEASQMTIVVSPGKSVFAILCWQHAIARCKEPLSHCSTNCRIQIRWSIPALWPTTIPRSPHKCNRIVDLCSKIAMHCKSCLLGILEKSTLHFNPKSEQQQRMLHSNYMNCKHWKMENLQQVKENKNRHKFKAKMVKTAKQVGPTTSNVSASTPLEVAKSAECQITLLPLPSAVADRSFFGFFLPTQRFLTGFQMHICGLKLLKLLKVC